MIRVAEFEYIPSASANDRRLEIQINKFFETAEIERKNLIDIRYTVTAIPGSWIYYAMVIYDDKTA